MGWEEVGRADVMTAGMGSGSEWGVGGITIGVVVVAVVTAGDETGMVGGGSRVTAGGVAMGVGAVVVGVVGGVGRVVLPA